MLCLKKRRTYSFTQGACNDIPRRSAKQKNGYNETLNLAVTTLPRKHRSREERSSGGMVLTVTEDTPADMLAGSMELLVQLPRDHNVHTQRVTVPRSTPMMDLLVQIATAHKLSASSYTLQAIGERGLVLPHQPNTPIGALDALQVKLLPKQGTFIPKRNKQANQPFETTFRLQVLLPRNQLYVSRVSPKMNLGKILEEVCREKNLDKNKYELRHPANLEERLDLSLSLQDYNLQEVTLYAKQGRTLGAALSSQDIMALQRQEERRRQQAKQSMFGFMFRKSKESSLSIDSLGERSVSPARSDETGRSVSPLAPPPRPLRKRRPAPKPPVRTSISTENEEESKDKLVISHSRNSSDSSGYHEASVLSDNPESARMPETLPRRSKPPCKTESSRKLAQTLQSSKSLGNIALASEGLSHAASSSSISSTGLRKKRAAPPPPIARPLSSAISSQALERIIDSEESLTSDIDISKSPSDIAASSKANSDIGVSSKANSDIGVHSLGSKPPSEIGYKIDAEFRAALADHEDVEIERPEAIQTISGHKGSSNLRENLSKPEVKSISVSENKESVEIPRVAKRETRRMAPTPKPRSFVREASIPSESSKKIDKEEREESRRNDELRTSTKNEISYEKNIQRQSSKKHQTEVELRNKIVNQSEEKMKRESWKNVQKEIVEPQEKKILTNGKSKSSQINEDKKSSENRTLKHVKSLDDLYSLSLEFPDEEIDERKNSTSSSRLSCAVISTIPKCSHLTTDTDENIACERKDSMKDKKLNDVSSKLSTTKRHKIFRSQSALNDFELNPFEKKPRHKTSHYEDFNCALNPNVSHNGIDLEVDEKSDDVFVEDEVEKKNIFPDSSDLVAIKSHSQDPRVVDNWEPQLIEESVSDDRPTETDILLQKVSDTLSNSLPPPNFCNSNEGPVEKLSKDRSTEKSELEKVREPRETSVKSTPKIETKSNDVTKTSRIVSADVTFNSQQDTSDYVSATGDDLSITDWEYQLPAPPSAFRDNVSSDYDGYDTITLRSVEAFKDPTIETTLGEICMEKERVSNASVATSYQSPISSKKEIPRIPEKVAHSETPVEVSRREEVEPEKLKLSSQISQENKNADSAESRNFTSELKKEIISELSTKIGNGSLPQSSGKNVQQECCRSSTDSKSSKIAPVDNTLSNFTITTYSRQKSLNIFEEVIPVEEKRSISKFTNSSKARSYEGSTIDRANTLNGENKISSTELLPERAQSEERVPKPEMNFEKEERFSQHNSLQRHSSFGKEQEKSANVYRSKSHITLVDNSKYRENGNGDKFDENTKMKTDDPVIFKSTSVTNLNHDTPKSNEKFSQWRENILKRQEEPSTEKQLQSLQVLKNILPRLKGSQQTEEDVPDLPSKKENNSNSGSNTPVEAKSIETKSSVEEPKKDLEVTKSKSTEDAATKRYKYTGPPAISLGSWSERPRVNVQLKMDQDYKFATGTNTSGAKTCVNLNGSSKQTSVRSFSKPVVTNGSGSNDETAVKRDSDQQLAKKLITHTTATGFKKPVLNRTIFSETSRIDDRPIVTSVALKKTHVEKSESKELEDDVKIDTKPVNFEELSKTFGQEVCLRTKPKRTLQNRHSDYYGSKPDILQNLSNVNGHANVWESANRNALKHADSMKITNVNQNNNHGTTRRYTSVVGIQPSNNNFVTEKSEVIPRNYTTSTKLNGLMPVVKGFKISTSNGETKSVDKARENGVSTVDLAQKVSSVPPPPTMPIITGVTLKNGTTTRPKSMPVCNIDPRDQLLESIRSFGGRDRLKSVQS